MNCLRNILKSRKGEYTLQLMCQPRMSELYVESNGLHSSGEMYEVSEVFF